MNTHLKPDVKHDMVFLFDITDGNPNGDPDAGNRPRTDDETSHGLATDASIKRKVRDTVSLVLEARGVPLDRYSIFISAGDPLNARIEQVLTQASIDRKRFAKGKAVDGTELDQAHRAVANAFWDVRMFGAVIGTGDLPGLGHIRGPLQFANARSADPVSPVDHAITRVVATSEKRAANQTEMGGKWVIPYGLYRMHMHYSAPLGLKTGVTPDDLEVLYMALTHMFEHTRSAARSEMYARRLDVFTHSSPLGDVPAQQLLDRVRITRRDGVDVPRAWTDYDVSVDSDALPAGVTHTRLI